MAFYEEFRIRGGFHIQSKLVEKIKCYIVKYPKIDKRKLLFIISFSGSLMSQLIILYFLIKLLMGITILITLDHIVIGIIEVIFILITIICSIIYYIKYVR